MSETSTRTTHAFQTEARQLLDLMIHSLYSNKEIFLRELVSNASDACDKLRFEALTDAALIEEDPDLAIDVAFDRAARTITVTDNGVGMSRQEVVDNIGTIARSGTREFVARLTGDHAQDAQLIGQFGVGFYSSFIVAERVTLTTRRAGLGADDAVRWESTGEGEYTLETVSREARGTEVTLHLRAGAPATGSNASGSPSERRRPHRRRDARVSGPWGEAPGAPRGEGRAGSTSTPRMRGGGRSSSPCSA